MSDIGYSGQYLDNKQFRIKVRTGSDINNVKDAIVGEIFLENFSKSSLSFDGVSSYMGSEPIERLNGQTWDTTTPVSQSAWVKINTYENNAGVFGIGRHNNDGSYNSSFVGGTGGFHMYNNQLFFYLGGNTGAGVVSATINTGVWYLLTWTWDGTNGSIYVNGQLDSTFTHGSNGFSTYFSIWAGGGGRWNGYADCLVDELAVWDSALSATDVNSIYEKGPKNIPLLSPLAWYRMEEGVDIPDASGNSNGIGKLFDGATFSRDTPHPPALYTCTDTSGTIFKITDLTERMGDVPMLKLNSSNFTSHFFTSPESEPPLFPTEGHDASYSFWFYDDGSDTTSSYTLIEHTDATPKAVVQVNHSSTTLSFPSHGNMTNPTSTIDPSIVTTFNTGFSVKYKRNKLNNITFVKIQGTTYPDHATGSRYVYLNGELIASDIGSSYFTYPQGGFIGLNFLNNNASLLLGDILYWDQDIKDIAGEIYDPIGGHKGHPSDGRNLSIPPKHYWKLGAPLEDGKIKDIGTDGTNHFTLDASPSDQFEYKNILGIVRS